jgi:hypothetical protein
MTAPKLRAKTIASKVGDGGLKRFVLTGRPAPLGALIVPNGVRACQSPFFFYCSNA